MLSLSKYAYTVDIFVMERKHSGASANIKIAPYWFFEYLAELRAPIRYTGTTAEQLQVIVDYTTEASHLNVPY